MWTGIIAPIAFCVGFFVASLLASAKAADTEMKMLRRTAPSPDDCCGDAAPGSSAPEIKGAAHAKGSSERGSNRAELRAGRIPIQNDHRRFEAT